MRSFLCLSIFCLFYAVSLSAQGFNFSKILNKKKDTIRVLNSSQQDSLYLQHPFRDKVNKFKQDFKKKWDKSFVEFTDNQINLLAGLNFSKQNIDPGGFSSPFNYNLNQYNSNGFKTGFLLGYRVDGKYKEKHAYSFSININKYSTGTYYKTSSSLSPFIGSFSSFKADDQFLTIGFAAHYKKILPIMDTSKYRLFFVLGPNLETRVSNQSLDNQVIGAYHKFLLRGDLGVEFDNNGYYTIFLHYHQPFTSFTGNSIKTNLTTIELGMMIKASDYF